MTSSLNPVPAPDLRGVNIDERKAFLDYYHKADDQVVIEAQAKVTEAQTKVAEAEAKAKVAEAKAAEAKAAEAKAAEAKAAEAEAAEAEAEAALAKAKASAERDPVLATEAIKLAKNKGFAKADSEQYALAALFYGKQLSWRSMAELKGGALFYTAKEAKSNISEYLKKVKELYDSEVKRLGALKEGEVKRGSSRENKVSKLKSVSDLKEFTEGDSSTPDLDQLNRAQNTVSNLNMPPPPQSQHKSSPNSDLITSDMVNQSNFAQLVSGINEKKYDAVEDAGVSDRLKKRLDAEIKKRLDAEKSFSQVMNNPKILLNEFNFSYPRNQSFTAGQKNAIRAKLQKLEQDSFDALNRMNDQDLIATIGKPNFGTTYMLSQDGKAKIEARLEGIKVKREFSQALKRGRDEFFNELEGANSTSDDQYELKIKQAKAKYEKLIEETYIEKVNKINAGGDQATKAAKKDALEAQKKLELAMINAIAFEYIYGCALIRAAEHGGCVGTYNDKVDVFTLSVEEVKKRFKEACVDLSEGIKNSAKAHLKKPDEALYKANLVVKIKEIFNALAGNEHAWENLPPEKQLTFARHALKLIAGDYEFDIQGKNSDKISVSVVSTSWFFGITQTSRGIFEAMYDVVKANQPKSLKKAQEAAGAETQDDRKFQSGLAATQDLAKQKQEEMAKRTPQGLMPGGVEEAHHAQQQMAAQAAAPKPQ